MYIWERQDWPRFTWDDGRLLAPLASTRLKQGRLLGGRARLSFGPRFMARVESLTEEVIRSAEIEGEILDRDGVRLSLLYHLGAYREAIAPADRRIEGAVEVILDATILDATEMDGANLTSERLLGWQAAVFPTGYSGMRRIRTGAWRDDAEGPKQVVSGPIGHQRVHYQAPPAERLDAEMQAFLKWFRRRSEPEGLLRAGLAHLWFVTLHPFEAGNGRVARAITDQALAQSEGSVERFYSLSGQIRKEGSDYTDALESAQKGTLDATDWLVWFLGCLSRAIDGADSVCADVLRKADFWQRCAHLPLTQRQITVLSRCLDGIEGNLTARKWAAIGKCSIPTAQRDITDLLERGILQDTPGGSKNTSYVLNMAA